MSVSFEDESDRADGVPHPRHARRLIGQANAERALLEAYKAGRLPHAIILGGPAGIGKATLAWRLTKFLLDHPRPGADDVRDAVDLGVRRASEAAAQIAALSHPDVVLLRREVNEKTKRFFTEIRADDVRRAIGLFQRAAGAGGYRICIVDSAEDLNRSSANALLKLIEEPPPLSLFVLIAHRPGLLLPTIRSRARLIRLDPLTPGEIGAVLDVLGPPWSALDEGLVVQAATRAQGSVREALRLLDPHGAAFGAMVRQLLDQLPAIDWRDVHKLADTVAGRDGEVAYDATLTAVFDWLDATVRTRAQQRPRRLAPYAEVWEKVAQSVRETDALNLDRRPLVLSIFSDLSAAARAAAA